MISKPYEPEISRNSATNMKFRMDDALIMVEFVVPLDHPGFNNYDSSYCLPDRRVARNFWRVGH